MKLIQGVFFQSGQGLGLGFDDRGEIGVYVHEGLMQAMFAGFLVEDPSRGWSGVMQDHFGTSSLASVDDFGSPPGFCFDKKYEGREDLIHYRLTVKVGNEWFGTYEGPRCGKGVCRLVITDVPDDFQDPKKVLEGLRLESAHTWPDEE